MNKPLNEDLEFLAHFGTKGMKWGVRKDKDTGTSRKVSREARKDAEESARAKLYYGDGAGTRRKLINTSVADKSKRSAEYKQAFDHHLAKQNLSQHAEKARSERKSTDRKTKNKQRRGAIARNLTGERGTQAAFVAAGLAGAAYLNTPSGQANMRKAASAATNFVNSQKARRTANFVADYIRRNS